MVVRPGWQQALVDYAVSPYESATECDNTVSADFSVALAVRVVRNERCCELWRLSDGVTHLEYATSKRIIRARLANPIPQWLRYYD